MRCSALMKSRAVPIVGLSLVLLAGARSGSSQPRDPWLGTWSLNFAKSSQTTEGPRYKRVTSRIEPWADGLKVSYDMVGTRGGVTHWEWTGRFDGKDYPMQGVDTVMTNAYRKIDAQSYEIVVKVDGNVAAVSRVTVSPDGRTLNVVTGQTTTSVYERTAEDHQP